MIVALGSDDQGPELEQTLQRLMRRVAMMLQAEKCVFLLHDRERNEFIGRPPAFGLTLNQVLTLRLAANSGISAIAFNNCEPVIVQQVELSDTTDQAWMERLGVRNLVAHPVMAELSDTTDQAWMERLGVRNLVAHPVMAERRDDSKQGLDHVPLGVLHVINKRGKDKFTGEDLHLLSVMARQVSAIITKTEDLKL